MVSLMVKITVKKYQNRVGQGGPPNLGNAQNKSSFLCCLLYLFLGGGQFLALYVVGAMVDLAVSLLFLFGCLWGFLGLFLYLLLFLQGVS